jgi:alginate O-acetyltransferase complex protein AlgJ
MSKTNDKLLIAVFLVVITLPLAVQLVGSATGTEQHEKRKLTALPAFPTTWAKLYEFPDKFGAYYRDRFGLRSKLIRWHAVAMYRALGISPSDKVLAGRDGWFYYADDYSLEDYRSLQPFREEELAQWKRVLEEWQDWLAQRGAKLLLVLSCDKYVIYPEYLPTAIHRAPGAFIGYREILTRIGQQPLAYDPVEKTTEGWDLARMMGLNDIIHEEDRQLQPRAPRHAKVVEIDRPDPTWNVGRVALEVNNSALPRLVMFRDSFGSALVPFLAEHFRRSVFLWQYDFDPQVIEKEKPAWVILLITSRRMQWYRPENPPLAKSD